MKSFHYMLAVCSIILLIRAHGNINIKSAFISRSTAYFKGSSRESKRSTLIEIAYNEISNKRRSLKFPLQISSEENNSSTPLKKKELTLDTIVEMIEVTFVNACLQLSKGYVDVLKLFIVAVKTGFGMGLNVPEIVEKLDNFTIQSANRPLMPEEVKLRTVWINIVYMMMENFSEGDELNVKNSSVDVETREKYKDYINFITDWRKQQNFDDRDAAAMVAEFKVDNVLNECCSTTSLLTDAMEKAMLPQNLRVAVVTLTVLEEEKRCFDDKMPPQPNIPGTK